jgi:hypothetical protein
MGMFDTLIVEAPLPDPRFQKCNFQTKDLGCNLDRCTLKADGSLVLTQSLWIGEGESEEQEERPMSDFVGKVFFYEYRPLPGIAWVEFCAVIVDGKLHRPIEKVRLEHDDGTDEWDE